MAAVNLTSSEFLPGGVLDQTIRLGRRVPAPRGMRLSDPGGVMYLRKTLPGSRIFREVRSLPGALRTQSDRLIKPARKSLSTLALVA